MTQPKAGHRPQKAEASMGSESVHIYPEFHEEVQKVLWDRPIQEEVAAYFGRSIVGHIKGIFSQIEWRFINSSAMKP